MTSDEDGRTAAADDSDALLRFVRWLALGFIAVQFALYTPPTGVAMPFSRWVGALAGAPLLLLNLVSLGVGGRLNRRSPRAWMATRLWVDAAVAMALVTLFSFDPTSALWALLVLPVLEGALTGRLRGAVTMWAAVAVAYLARDLWAAHRYPQAVFFVDSVTYRLGIVGIVALATGSLARGLAAREAEGEALRRVAVATRQMSTLDDDEVLRQVVSAGVAAGFPTVQVLVPEGAGGWRAHGGPAWTRDLPAGVAAVLEDTQRASDVLPLRALRPQAAEQGRLVVAPLRSADAVLAVLVAEHAGPVPGRKVEALELLAAHAAIAVGNARLHGQREAVQAALAHQAVHDSLTELPNRRLLHDRATQALAARRRDGSTLAVLLLDLDGFKEINDTFGHSYGDALLRQVAGRLSATVRGADTAARLGGDEFAVLAVGLASKEDAELAAARVQEALHRPFQVAGMTLDVEASIGVAVAPEHGDDIDTLLRCADVAMYAAKRSRAGITVYDPTADEHRPDRLSLLGDLRRALEAPEQLQLHYQPKIDTALGALVGVEALLRWHHPERGLIPPADFIPTAEGTGLIHPLTRHVLDTALAQARRWHDEGQWVPVAVNLSTRCLLDLTLPEQVAGLLDKHALPPALLRLEITETSIMADPQRALDVLHALADQGVRLSIDDFGTGYSSMSYLRLLPVDELKVDRSFVNRMCTVHDDAVVVRSMVELGHNLGLHVVAEGVEDADTLEALGEIGCDVIQGYYTGRPMPSDALAGWLEESTARRSRPPVSAGRPAAALPPTSP